MIDDWMLTALGLILSLFGATLIYTFIVAGYPGEIGLLFQVLFIFVGVMVTFVGLLILYDSPIGWWIRARMHKNG